VHQCVRVIGGMVKVQGGCRPHHENGRCQWFVRHAKGFILQIYIAYFARRKVPMDKASSSRPLAPIWCGFGSRERNTRAQGTTNVAAAIRTTASVDLKRSGWYGTNHARRMVQGRRRIDHGRHFVLHLVFASLVSQQRAMPYVIKVESRLYTHYGRCVPSSLNWERCVHRPWMHANGEFPCQRSNHLYHVYEGLDGIQQRQKWHGFVVAHCEQDRSESTGDSFSSRRF
jgi:hypothetical protein